VSDVDGAEMKQARWCIISALSKQIRIDQNRSKQIKTDQNRSKQIKTDQTTTYLSSCAHVLYGAAAAAAAALDLVQENVFDHAVVGEVAIAPRLTARF
jgi:hypothetical protein